MKYKKGSGFVAGIPARDLSDADIEKYVVPLLKTYKIKEDPKTWLASTGLYEPEEKKPKSKPKLMVDIGGE